MAQAVPLFVTTRDQLRKQLRLGGLPKESDGDALLDDAIRFVRVSMRDAIGQGSIDAILATPWTESPTTDAQHKRMLAASVEGDWIRYRLLITSPMRVADSIAGRVQTFQDEGFDRVYLAQERQQIQEALWASILQGIQQLRGADKIGDGPTPSVSVSEPIGAATRHIAWDSIR